MRVLIGSYREDVNLSNICRAVEFSWSFKDKSMFLSNNSLTISILPYIAASCKAEPMVVYNTHYVVEIMWSIATILLTMLLTSWPALMIDNATITCPLRAARCKGLNNLYWLAESNSGQCDTRRLTVSIRPYKDARSNGVSPLMFTSVASARCYNNNCYCLSKHIYVPEEDTRQFQCDHIELLNEVPYHQCYSKIMTAVCHVLNTIINTTPVDSH